MKKEDKYKGVPPLIIKKVGELNKNPLYEKIEINTFKLDDLQRVFEKLDEDSMLEDDSSDGVNEVRIFCFDWLILNTTKCNMRFTAHDSRIFANMDPRQRKVLFKIVNEVCKDSEFQYICSVNQDTLDSVKGLMEDNEYKEMIADNIILELNDDAPESKLLGIQIDIDLEDKDKSSVDMK